MVEIERVRHADSSEREKTRAMIKTRKEKEASAEVVKATVECPECGSRNLEQDYERAELVCADCGVVVDAEFVDQGPEWRAFDHDQRMKRSRVGAPMTYTIHDKGLSTMIDWRNRDSYGKSISLWSRNQWKRERYAPSFHLDDENLDPKTWCRFPILSGGFEKELGELQTRLEAVEGESDA